MTPQRFVTEDPDDGFTYISAILGRRAELLDYSNFRLSIETTALELITINVFELCAGIAVRSTGVRQYALSRIETGGIERQWNSRRSVFAAPGQAILDAPGNETFTRTAGLRFTAFSIPPDLIQTEAGHLIGEPPSAPLEIHHAIDLGPLDSLMNELSSEARAGGFREDSQPFRIDLQRKLISALISEIPNNYESLLGKTLGPPARRYVSALIGYLSANLRSSVTLGDMAMAVGVSKRRLLESCRDAYRLPPMAMLQQMRLEAIRAQLEDPEPRETVNTIARKFCFGHMGNFARYYQRAFGEIPSETLRRGKRKNGL